MIDTSRYPLKHQRLEELEQAGFNVADFVHFSSELLSSETGRLIVRDHLHEFLKKHKVLGLRSFHPDERKMFKGPVKYGCSEWSEIEEFVSELPSELHLLVNEGIPTKPSLATGNILLQGLTQHTIIEYLEGPFEGTAFAGTPRDLEFASANRIKQLYVHGNIASKLTQVQRQILSLAERLSQTFRGPDRPVIVEFTIYPTPVGKLKQTSLVWEWRRG